MGVGIMFKLIFINSRGKSVELFSSPYRLIKVEGIGDVEADVQSQKSPYQDGDTFIDSVLEPRFITVELKITGKTNEELSTNRKKLASVFNPKLGLGLLRYVNGNEVKEIMALAEAVPAFPDGSTNRGTTFQKALIQLMAPNPYWVNPESVSEPMTAYIGLFEFPVEFPTQMGEQGSKQVFTNDGDVSTPVQIEFNGPATNPKVSNNTTGEFFKLNRTLADGEKLIVDTTFGNKRVEITDVDGNVTNVLNWMDLDSTFFQLIPGDNEVAYTADSGRDNAVVSITWRNRFIGI